MSDISPLRFAQVRAARPGARGRALRSRLPPSVATGPADHPPPSAPPHHHPRCLNFLRTPRPKQPRTLPSPSERAEGILERAAGARVQLLGSLRGAASALLPGPPALPPAPSLPPSPSSVVPLPEWFPPVPLLRRLRREAWAAPPSLPACPLARPLRSRPPLPLGARAGPSASPRAQEAPRSPGAWAPSWPRPARALCLPWAARRVRASAARRPVRNPPASPAGALSSRSPPCFPALGGPGEGPGGEQAQVTKKSEKV